MGDVLDYVVYLALRVAWWVARQLPLAVVRAALEGLGDVVYWADAHHRRVALENLARAFPQWREDERRNVARQAFRNWGRIAAELAHPEAMACGATLESVRAMERKADELGSGGRGVLALTAHTANFELLARLLGQAGGRRVAVFHRRMANRFVGELLRRQRDGMNVATLGRGMIVREALRVLERGDILVVPLDQNQRRGAFVDFFGQPACTSTMLARLSMATGLPVQPAFAVWQGDDLVAVLGEKIAPPALRSTETRAQAVRDLTQRYTREVEALVTRYPAQWNWAHRRWKTQPDEPPVVGPTSELAKSIAPPVAGLRT